MAEINKETKFADGILYHGCTLEEIKKIPNGSVDAICTDLPYGTTQNKWDIIIPMEDFITIEANVRGRKKTIWLNQSDFLMHAYISGTRHEDALATWVEIHQKGLWHHYWRVLKPNGVIILTGDGKFTSYVMNSTPYHRYNLIWQKTNPTGFFNARRMPLRSHEDIMIFYRKLPTYNPQKTTGHPRKVSTASHRRNSKVSSNYGNVTPNTYDSTERFPTSVWKFATDKQKEHYHSNQKPVALIEELVKTYTNPGDTVLDNTCGSGTTGVACRNTGRKFILIEKSESDCKNVIKRLTK